MNETPTAPHLRLPAYVISADGVTGVLFSYARVGQVRRRMQRALERFGLQVEYYQITVQRDESLDAVRLSDGQTPEMDRLYDPEELTLPTPQAKEKP